jgi:plasmid replication initiation protein
VSHKRRRERLEAPADCEGTKIWKNEILDKTIWYINAETSITIAGSMDKEQRKKVGINMTHKAK